MKHKVAIYSATILLALGSAAALADSMSVIPKFNKVSDGIYRGGRPGSTGMAELKASGFKTVLNIDDDSNAIQREKKDAAALGLLEVSIPMSAFWKPKNVAVNRTLAILANPANYPIFIHCMHGEDRTGMVVALFRVEYELEDPADAYKEMLALGFHKELSNLHHYYLNRTGYQP